MIQIRYLYADEIRESLGVTPLESGYVHPIEARIARWLSFKETETLAALELLARERGTADDAAILLGRLPRPIRETERVLAALTGLLASPSLVVRDASVRALECVGTEAAHVALREHVERGGEVPWLADYIRRVIA